MLSLGALPLPNSHWTGYVSAGYSPSEPEVVLPCEEGGVGLKVFPHCPEVLWQSSEEEHYLSDPVSLSVPSSTLLPHQEEDTQMRKIWVFTQPSSDNKISIKPGFSRNASWVKKHRSWPI